MSVDCEEMKESFLKQVCKHEISIECDNGVHRCIHFAIPDRSQFWFRLITWPGGLTITGDYGTYSFTRVADMFGFFRSQDNKLQINPGYWAEKLISTDTRSGHEEFSCKGNEFHIRDAYKNYAIEEPDSEKREDIRGELRSAFGNYPDNLQELWGMIDEVPNASIRNELVDVLYDISLTGYTTRFIWCLWAIVWGIREYDRATAGSKAA